MVKFLLGIATAAGVGKWIDSKTDNTGVRLVSDLLLFWGLYKFLRRK
ncbi:MAG: hypothetical protein OSJ76_00410 [Alphaproteobacteria bacterium]|nr:hypothetical protein [Alphaproteobacteria bacterium]